MEKIEGLKVKGHCERKCENEKIVFRAYLHQKWINLRQTKTKLISCQLYTYPSIHYTRMPLSVTESRITQRPSGRAPTCFTLIEFML